MDSLSELTGIKSSSEEQSSEEKENNRRQDNKYYTKEYMPLYDESLA